MKSLKIIEEISNNVGLSIYRNKKSNPDAIVLIDFDCEIMKLSIINTDELNESYGIAGIGELKIELYNHADFEEISSFSDLKFVVSPNCIYIIMYYLIGGRAIRLENDNIQLFLNSFIKKSLPNKVLNLESENYQEWFQAWNQLKNKLNIEDLDFHNFVKYSVFNDIMKNGINKKFFKTSCFGFRLSSKTTSDTCHIVFSLENKEHDLVSVGVKVIPRRNSTLQNFSFYKSQYPIQPYSHISDAKELEKIIKNNSDFYNIIEIDEWAGLINNHKER
jgi:hypothetical protein